MSGAEEYPWRIIDHGLVLLVRLTPRGGRDAIEGIERGAEGRAMLKARVRSAPADGEANAALCRLIALTLGVAARDVTVAGGAASRMKRIRVIGHTATMLAALRRFVTD